MRKTRYGRRIAHGALALGFMSNTSTKILEGLAGTWVSYGYDRVRFPARLFIGDTVTVDYEIVERGRPRPELPPGNHGAAGAWLG